MAMSEASIRGLLKAAPGARPLARRLRRLRKQVRNLPRTLALLPVEAYLRTASGRILSDQVQQLEERLAMERDQSRRLRHLLDDKIAFLDVGARHGPPYHFAQYAEFFDFYLVEPEPLEAQRLRDADYYVIDKALSDSIGEITLNVTRKPGSSSMAAPGGPMASYLLPDPSVHDVIKRISIPGTTIDAVAAERGVAFHLAKFDTQGTETIILQGMKTCRPMVVMSEVFTGACYQQRPTFYDLCSELYDRGYLPYWFKMSRTPPPAARSRVVGRSWPGLPITGDIGFIPDWSRPEGLAIILQDDLKYAAVMLTIGLENVLRFVVSEVELPHATRIREVLAMALPRTRIAQGNMALKP